MKIKALALALFFFSMFFCGTFAFEISLAETGLTAFTVEEASTTDCRTISFSIPEETLLGTRLPIFSINADFNRFDESDAKISVTINDGTKLIAIPKDFVCNGNCWARIFLSKSELKESNTAELCITTGEVTKNATIFSESKLGFYDTPRFTLKKESPSSILLGERAEMKITAKNIGSKESEVQVQFVSPVVREIIDITSFDVIEGESSVQTVIAPGETKEFVYHIKPNQASAYNLPAAVLFFENIFGKEQIVLSSHPQLEVVAPEKIKVLIVAGEPKQNIFSFKIIAENTSNEPFEGLLRISHEEVVEGAISKISLLPKAKKEFSFESELPAGDYNFFAVIADENFSFQSDSVLVEIPESGISKEVYFAIFGAIVSLSLLAIIYLFWKEGSKK